MADLQKIVETYEAVYATEGEERPSPFDVEAYFDEFVRHIGGLKISDLIDDNGRMQQNADYLFKDENVIIELKTIDGTYSGDEGQKAFAQAFIDAGHGDDLIPCIVGAVEMPDAVRAKIVKRTRRGLEGRVKKARAQIKQSRTDFGDDETFGMIVVAMNKPPIFGQPFMLSVLAHMMDNLYGKDAYIDGIVYINPNVPSSPNKVMEFSGWFPLYMTKDVDSKLSTFVDRIGSEWLNFVASKLGGRNPILKFDVADQPDFGLLLRS